jgi:hypothetical protein
MGIRISYFNIDDFFLYVIDQGIIIRDSEGKAIRMVGAMTDITDQKNNDDTVRRIKSRIAKIYARTRKLKFKIKNIA